MPTPKPARSIAPNPQPIQFTPFSLSHFKTPEGLAFFNQFMAQVVNQQNRSVGTAGPVVLPSGINVAGSTVTGLGTPTGPTDAVSSGHAEANYGASSTAKALDIGGTNTLKGLASVYQTTQNNAPLIAAIPGIQAVLKPGISGTLTLVKVTGGGANGSITILNGIVTAFTPPT